MTKEQIEDRLNGLIDEIVDAERDFSNAEFPNYHVARREYEETRKRVMDTLMEIYIG